LRLLPEVELRRRLDAVPAVAHVDLVAVEGEDLVLGERLLDLQRQDHLLELAADRLLRLQEERAGELLRDGAGPLGLPEPDDVRYDRAGDAAEVNPHVLVEARVFRGDQRVEESLRDLIEADDNPLLGAELVEDLAVGSVDRGDDVRLPVLKLADLGDVERED